MPRPAPPLPNLPTAASQPAPLPAVVAPARAARGRRQGRQVRADLALLAVTAVWGATFVMVKDALAFAGPFTFLAVRFGLATALLAPALLLTQRGRAAWTTTAAASGLLIGLALFAGYAFQTAGLQFTTPARAAFITGLSVVIVPLLSSLALHRPVSRGVWLGVGLAAAGMALLSLGPDLLAGGPVFAAETALGDLLVLGCAAAFAVHIVLVGHFAPRHGTLALMLAQLFATAALSLVVALGAEQPRPEQIGAVLPAAAFTGVFATVVALTVQVRAQRFTTPTHAALIFSTEPVFGAAFAYLLVGEVLPVPALVGCVLILAGMVVAQLTE